MKNALTYIESHKQKLLKHAFIASLRTPEPDLRRAMSFAPFGMFWVLSFQDIIKINAKMSQDPTIREFIESHVKEDTGHQEWFFEDIKNSLGAEDLDIRWLFSAQNLPTREISFALASEVYHMGHEPLRLVLIESLEAAASVYLGSISQFFIESGHGQRLKYFAPSHLDVESEHEIFSDEAALRIRSIQLAPEASEQAEAMVDRIFAAFHRFGDFLLEQRHVPLPAREHGTSSPE